jgi:hypothetical protein
MQSMNTLVVNVTEASTIANSLTVEEMAECIHIWKAIKNNTYAKDSHDILHELASDMAVNTRRLINDCKQDIVIECYIVLAYRYLSLCK